MEEFKVKIKALTPIWTGGVERKCDRLHETGIIGSLRWWYEAIVRGLGGYACDPTDTKCEGKNHCEACELFGCTGWARKFRLHVLDNNFKLYTFSKYRHPLFKMGKKDYTEFSILEDKQTLYWPMYDIRFQPLKQTGDSNGY